MLITFSEIDNILLSNNIKITGALHIGAHDCEELSFYNKLGLNTNDIIWIDAIEEKVLDSKQKGIQNVYHATITDKDDDMVTFNISNNGQSSSVLEFGTHATEHPHVHYIKQITQKTLTIDTFFKKYDINPTKYNFWNFDIQGAELMALKGATNIIQYANAIYLEVNIKELYKGCALMNEIDDFLLKYNFKRVLTNITQHGWGDALYIKK